MIRNLVIYRNRKIGGIGRELSTHFDCYETTPRFRPRVRILDGAKILNVGAAATPVWYNDVMRRGCSFINTPEAVRRSVNKIATLTAFEEAEVRTLVWTTERQVAQDLVDEGIDVIVRSLTQASQGRGMGRVGRDFEDGDHTGVVPRAPLYTAHYDKNYEFRVFVVNGQAVDIVQKKRIGKARREEEGIVLDNLIRSHTRGWIFAHEGLRCGDGMDRADLMQLGVNAAVAVGLDFCAVDILAKYSRSRGLLDSVVCETNSAPGITSPTTFDKVTRAITEEYLI